MTNTQPRVWISPQGYERLQRELTPFVSYAALQPSTGISMKTVQLFNERGRRVFNESMMC